MLRHNLQSKTCVHSRIVSLSDGGGDAVVRHLFSSVPFPDLLFLFLFLAVQHCLPRHASHLLDNTTALLQYILFNT